MVHCIYLCNPKGNCQEVKTLDKYEYSLKLDEIKKLVTSGNYEEAVKVADTVDGSVFAIPGLSAWSVKYMKQMID